MERNIFCKVPFFFLSSLFLLRHRSGVINETSNASRDSNVFQFASNFRRSHCRALILILTFFKGKEKELFCFIRFYKFQKLIKIHFLN